MNKEQKKRYDAYIEGQLKAVALGILFVILIYLFN
jgi:hypothetical protein